MNYNKSESMKKINIRMTKALAKQEHKVYKDSDKIKRINPLITLLNNGTITETQAEKILMKQMYLYHTRRVKSIIFFTQIVEREVKVKQGDLLVKFDMS